MDKAQTYQGIGCMNSPFIVREIEALGHFLDMAYLPKTAAAVRQLAAVDLRTRDQDLWFDPLLETTSP